MEKIMNKELIDRTWSLLPKEFKEEVKNEYKGTIDNAPWEIPAKGYIRGRLRMMRELFGIHNLTSDAEGEVELLHVTRQKVMGLYSNAKKLHDLYTSATCINEAESRTIDHTDGIMRVLKNLFGSKCLPDENSSNLSKLEKNDEPKPAEPTEEVSPNVNHSDIDISEIVAKGYVPDPAKQFDTIHKDTNESLFGKKFDYTMTGRLLGGENLRLKIAAQIVQGILSNPTAMNGPRLIDGDENILAKWSLKFADALISEAKKGGEK